MPSHKQGLERSATRRGVAYLCATPIGNLEDITLRALRVLREVDLIAAEDTRRTRKLLTHYEITGKIVSLHEHNERLVLPRLVERLKKGHSIAFVSDAGMPGIADPGHQLVRACIREDIDVEVIPGPSSLLTAAVLSGLPTHDLRFLGFLPRRRGQRQSALGAIKSEPSTFIVMEAPHRLIALLEDILAVLGDRQVAVLRELTKQFEEHRRGSASDVLRTLAERDIKGECVVAIAGSEPAALPVDAATLRQDVAAQIRDGAVNRRQAARRVAARYGMKTKEVYDITIEEESDS